MNAKERRQMASLQREVEHLRKLMDDHFRVYREQSYDLVKVRMENEAWREMAREILGAASTRIAPINKQEEV